VIGGVGLAGNGSGDGRRRGRRRSTAAAAMPASWRFGRPMHVHGRVQGGVGDAKAEHGLEQRRWMVGCTGELSAAAMAGAEERRGAAPEQLRGRRSAWGVRRA
jgi:hypothetical protein